MKIEFPSGNNSQGVYDVKGATVDELIKQIHEWDALRKNLEERTAGAHRAYMRASSESIFAAATIDRLYQSLREVLTGPPKPLNPDMTSTLGKDSSWLGITNQGNITFTRG